MTVGELVAILKDRPQDAPAFVWDGDLSQFAPVDCVSNPAGPHASEVKLPQGGVVIWGE
jgi:hypothetical protein